MGRTPFALNLCAILLAFPALTSAQEKKADAPPASEQVAEKTEVTTTETTPSSWLQGKKMTGDWGGVRTALEEKGIKFDLDVTQVMQGNAHGGASTNNGLRYSGSADITLTLDTGKMGLWPGGTFIINGEPKWGNGINSKVGSLMPVNMDAIKPTYGMDDCTMTLSEFYYQQVLFDGKLVILAGKLDGARAFDQNVFANDERTQFMNVAFRNSAMIGTFVPYTTLGVGVVVNPVDWWSIRTAVTDSDGASYRTGFDTAFHGHVNTSLVHEWDFTIKPFGKEGHQRVGFIWTNKDFDHLQPYTPFKQLGPVLTKLLPPVLMNKMMPLIPKPSSEDNVMIYYNFDQYFIQKEDDPQQGIGLFGRFAWARQDVNAACHLYSVGVGGKGMVPQRPRDTYGVGYYFLDLSNRMPAPYEKEQGIEMYYNVEVTPWLHISPDIQIIMDPGGQHGDTSFVYGLRMQVNL